MNFFALLEDKNHTLTTARIPVEQSLQNQMTTLFETQEKNFFVDDPDEVAFSPSHTPDNSEIAYIDKVPIPQAVIDSLNKPLQQDQLKLRGKSPERIKAIFAGEKDNQGLHILFQAFERRQVWTRQDCG